METRNIQKTGGSSYIVTLPKIWITKHNLTNNGSLDIYDTNKFILLRPSNKNIRNKFILKIENLNENQIIRKIIGLYVSGYDEIIIKSKTLSFRDRQVVRAVTYKLIGFELFDESSTSILIKNVAISTISTVDYITRMIDIVISINDAVINVLKNFDQKLAKGVIERDTEVDRINLNVMRSFNNMLEQIVHGDNNDIPLSVLHFYEHVSIRLERIADHYVRIAYAVTVLNKPEQLKVSKKELSNLKKLSKYLKLTRQVITKKEINIAHELLDLYEKSPKNEDLLNFIVKKPSVNTVIDYSIDRIKSYTANIAEEAINFLNSSKTN